MAEQKHRVSLSHRVTALRISPSPLNIVKFDLGIILVAGFLLFLAQERLIDNLMSQVLVLSAYGVVGMVWVVLHTRRVVTGILAKEEGNRNGAQ